MKFPNEKQPIKYDDILEIIEGLIKFPYAQICRHSDALELLNLCEEKGLTISGELAKAICNASTGDEKALELLKELRADCKFKDKLEKG